MTAPLDLYDAFEAAALRLKSARRGIDDARIELEIALEKWLAARAALSGAIAPEEVVARCVEVVVQSYFHDAPPEDEAAGSLAR